MKFYIRRAVFGLITAPIVALAYSLGYALVALAANQPMRPEADVVWLIAITYFLFIVWYPQINKLLNRVIG
jgi:hypothetical protein